MTVGTLIKLRRDTAANWTAADPVLSDGEPGYEHDTGRYKLGDGTTHWSALAYQRGDTGPTGATGPAGPVLPLDQITAPGADVSFASHKAINVADATADTDALNRRTGDARYDATGSAAAEQTRATAAEALLAPKASPVLTGHPVGVTEAPLDNSTRLSSTAYADAAVAVEAARATTAEATKATSAALTTEVSRATAAEALLQVTSAKDSANGYAGLDAGGLLKVAELPSSVVSASSPADTPPLTASGSQLVNVPPWKATTLYPANYVVQQGGVLYAANVTFTSAATWAADSANWTSIAPRAVELDYAQITSPFTTASAAAVDVPGLVINPTCDGRPALVEFFGVVQVTSAGALPVVSIYDVTAGAAIGSGAVYLGNGSSAGNGGSANSELPVSLRVRVAPAAGARQYKVQLLSSGSGGATNVKINAGVASATTGTPPAFLTMTAR